MRRGELCGLRWVDVDLGRGRIVVAQQVQRLSGQTLVGKPKTKAGEDRVVDLGGDAVATLRRVLERQDRERAEWGDDYAEHGLVFTWEDGRPYSPEDLTRRFPRLVKAFNTADDRSGAVAPTARFHDVRHLAASLLLNSGTSLPMLSKMFGHSSVVITSDLYGHLLEGIGQAAAERAAASIPRRGRPNPVRSLSEQG